MELQNLFLLGGNLSGIQSAESRTPNADHSDFLHNIFSKGWVARAPCSDR